jgi:hypothetical protein
MNKSTTMKAGWQLRKLGQLCQLISGQHIDSKDYNTESRGVGYLTGPSGALPIHAPNFCKGWPKKASGETRWPRCKK